MIAIVDFMAMIVLGNPNKQINEHNKSLSWWSSVNLIGISYPYNSNNIAVGVSDIFALTFDTRKDVKILMVRVLKSWKQYAVSGMFI